jgi:hypothetical protein
LRFRDLSGILQDRGNDLLAIEVEARGVKETP